MKLEKTLWRGPYQHAHKHSKQHRWGSLSDPRPFNDREDRACSPTISKVLQDATVRCPSVSINSAVMDGQPCINGTRIPVRAVLRAVELYGSVDEALRCYPQMSAQQVKDALYFSQILLESPSGLDETTVAD
jgi:uncharacterized protein (DUF433 family)